MASHPNVQFHRSSEIRQVAVRITPAVLEARIYDSAEPGEMDPYVAHCSIQILRNVAHVTGLSGKISRTQLRELVGEIQGLGATVVYLSRGPLRRMPYGERISEGDFAGFWRVSLSDVPRTDAAAKFKHWWRSALSKLAIIGR